MSFCLRIRFSLGPTLEVSSEASELSIPDPVAGKDARLKGERQKSISDSKHLSLTVKPFATAGEAEGEADRWVDALKIAFAKALIGADFGDRAPKGLATEAGLEMLEQAVGQRVINDIHGVSVFKCDPEPRFARIEVAAVVGKPSDRVTALIGQALERQVEMSPSERLSYDLFAASSREFSVDARFVMLMMAVETLIRCDPRAESVRQHVRSLITSTRRSEIPRAEKDSIVGNLNWLLNESIGQAGKKLASKLGDCTYMDGTESPEKFFSECYNLRSALVHGSHPRPSREDVSNRTAPLERYVADLLSLKIGDDE